MYLRISVTDRCNLRCIYCFPDNYKKLPKSSLLSFEELTTLVEILKNFGLRKVRITGGEPLLRRNICSLIEKIASLNIPIYLSTNGSFLFRFAADLKEAGIKRVNVGIDTLSPEKYRAITGRDLLDSVLSGIEEARRQELEVKINTVIMKGLNHDEATKFMETFLPKGIQVRFIELMPFPHTRERFHDLFMPYTELMEIIEKRYSLRAAGTEGVAKVFYVPELKGKVGFITPVSSPFCRGCDRLRVTASGRLKACLHSRHEVDIRKILRGKEPEKRLKEILTELFAIKGRIHKPRWESKSQMVEIGG